MKKVMNLKDLKNDMWIEVCEGDDSIEMSEEYKELVKNIGDGEASGGVYIYNFYELLDILINNNLIEFEGGEIDWICNYLAQYGEEDNYTEYYLDYLKLVN